MKNVLVCFLLLSICHVSLSKPPPEVLEKLQLLKELHNAGGLGHKRIVIIKSLKPHGKSKENLEEMATTTPEGTETDEPVDTTTTAEPDNATDTTTTDESDTTTDTTTTAEPDTSTDTTTTAEPETAEPDTAEPDTTEPDTTTTTVA